MPLSYPPNALSASSIRAHSIPIPITSDRWIMDAAVISSGETAEKRSGRADHTSISVGETGHKLSSPPEHPRVTRLRHRRLIAFLRDQGFRDSYKEVTNKTRAHMSLSHLRRLVRRGRWIEALVYLNRYLPPLTSPNNNSFRAKVLRQFLAMHHRFANAVDGIADDMSVPRNYLHLNNSRTVSHADLRLRSISFPILALEQVRAKINWEAVQRKASLVVSRLARSTPELRVYIALPATSSKPHHVLPIASGLRSRKRYVKKKQTGGPEAIVRALKSQQLMDPSIGSVEEAKELLADLLDETLRDGVQLITYGLFRPLQLGGNGGPAEDVVQEGLETILESMKAEIIKAETLCDHVGELHLQMGGVLNNMNGFLTAAQAAAAGTGAREIQQVTIDAPSIPAVYASTSPTSL